MVIGRKPKDAYKTSLNERLRKSPQYKEWRIKVFARDKYQCQKCGSNQRLHPHHLKEWAKYPELRFEITNGQTLCADCHGKIHGINFNICGKKLTCITCQKKYRPKSGHLKQKNCSKECGYKYRSTQPNPKKGRRYEHLDKYPTKKCPTCKTSFKATVHKSRNQKYCSTQCYLKARWNFTGGKAECLN